MINETQQDFKESNLNSIENNDYFEYPVMRLQQGAILPFEIIFKVKPEQNKIIYQDIEFTLKRLKDAGIAEANDMRDYDMSGIAKIVGAGFLVKGKTSLGYRSTSSSSSGSATTKAGTKKKIEIILKRL